jgi:CRP-like cAMP-binding protein
MTACVPADERVRVKRAALARQPLLAGCSAPTLRRFSAFADEVRVPAGDVIVEQGRHGLWFFVIERGRAEVVHDGRTAGVLGPGQFFGEAAVLRQVLQPSTIRALSDMTLFVIGCQRLVPLVGDSRVLRRRLGDLVHRPRAMVAPLTATVSWPASERHPTPPPVKVAPTGRRFRRRASATAIVVALAVGLMWHPPVAVVAPGPAFDVSRDIIITGVPTTPIHGRYLVPTVRATHPTLFGLGLELLHPHRRVVRLGDVVPPGMRQATLRRNAEQAFRRSQLLGAAAGARAAGFDVRVSGPPGHEQATLPFTVQFRSRPVGGPSAGLAYALAVEDMLDSADRAHGRTIGATGDIGVDGRVHPVGYVVQKAAAVDAAGAALLLVPDVEVTEAWGRGVDARGVGSLSEALATLGCAVTRC